MHGEKYDYSLVNYKTSHVKINIICQKHSVFEITSRQHLNGVNCTNCERERISFNQRKTTNDFINQAKISHGDTYDYSLVNYLTANKPVTIVCEKHGDFNNNFIRLARAVYHRNDERAMIKRQINEKYKSELVEEKSYQTY